MTKGLMILMLCMAVIGCTNHTSTKGDSDSVTIYFARHGKTLLNTADRVQGWIDSPLTAEGREVAKYLGEGLKGIPFDLFYTSDAGRQRETMEILIEQMGITNAQVHEDKNLREAFFGSFEGGFNKDMASGAAKALNLKDGKALFSQMRSGTLDSMEVSNAIAKADPSHTAETASQIKNRTQQALHDMVNTALANGNKTILVVSSRTAMQIMISDLTDNPDKNKPLSNATIVKITYHNGNYTVDEIGSKTYINQGKQRLDIK